MTGDQADKVMQKIEVFLLARLGRQPAHFDPAPDELDGRQLDVLFQAREELRAALVDAD